MDYNDREWGLAMMLTHGLVGVLIGAQLGLIAWEIYYGEASRAEHIYPLAEEMAYMAKASLAGFFGGCLSSKIFYNSSPFFFLSKPKELACDAAANESSCMENENVEIIKMII